MNTHRADADAIDHASAGTHADIATALLVIDAQESFRHRPYWSERDLPAYLDAQNALIGGFSERGLPIVRVLHVEDEGAFSEASGWVRPLDAVSPFAAALVVRKARHSALAGTPLAAWLLSRGIGRLVVSGIRTEQCCETTTRHASDMGFEVDYCTDATLTFAMVHAASGERFEAAAIKRRTELVLDGRFANIVSVEQALDRAGHAGRAALAALAA